MGTCPDDLGCRVKLRLTLGLMNRPAAIALAYVDPVTFTTRFKLTNTSLVDAGLQNTLRGPGGATRRRENEIQL